MEPCGACERDGVDGFLAAMRATSDIGATTVDLDVLAVRERSHALVSTTYRDSAGEVAVLFVVEVGPGQRAGGSFAVELLVLAERRGEHLVALELFACDDAATARAHLPELDGA